jgi:hypothetical protein
MEPWWAVDANNRGLEDKTEPWRFCRTVVVNSHHFDEEQDPYPYQVKDWIRIRIKVKTGSYPH